MFYGELKAVHIIITGSVQGVGYRAWCVVNAKRNDLDGWVRNRSDGSVEMEITGDPYSVQEMIEACWYGPVAASVEGVNVKEITANNLKKGFQLLPTL